MKCPIGLRVDVDTYRGTRLGVPELCRIMKKHSILASFFFSVGPDNMGRHLWRLLKPRFLIKMLRSNAASLYGWDILLRGAFRPGPIIGTKLGNVIQDCAAAGHEIGLHAWDHHAWQHHIERAKAPEIRDILAKGFDFLSRLGIQAVTSASPAWRCTDEVLSVKEQDYPDLIYNSDCRGEGVFLPEVNGQVLSQPQVPVNLPTYDEVVGHDGITATNYNEFLLSKLRPDSYNVLTIHAEVEGIVAAGLFENFVRSTHTAGYEFVPLSGLIPEDQKSLPTARIRAGEITGREGWVSIREDRIRE